MLFQDHKPPGPTPLSGSVTVHQAKTQLSRILRRVAAGEEVVIVRRHQPVAKIVALVARTPKDLRDDLKGKIRIARDFDATPDDFGPHT